MVSKAVNTPDDVDSTGVPKNGRDEEGVEPGLIPEVHGDHGW